MLADGVVTRQDGKLDIYGAGFDTIFASAVPARHARIVLALRFLLSRHEAQREHEVEVVVPAADGAELARASWRTPAASAEQAERIIPAGRQAGIGTLLQFEDLIFPEYGAYQFVVHWDTNEIRAIRLGVVETPARP